MKIHELILVAFVFLIVVGTAVMTWRRKRKPRTLNQAYFQQKWQETQSLCGKQEMWPLAVINADTLVDEALKKRKYKGKTMGERLMAAQHEIKENDQAWFAHKLRNKLVHEEVKKLKKKDVMDALLGFRAVLKDLGAL
jgi:hypothetical protein